MTFVPVERLTIAIFTSRVTSLLFSFVQHSQEDTLSLLKSNHVAFCRPLHRRRKISFPVTFNHSIR